MMAESADEEVTVMKRILALLLMAALLAACIPALSEGLSATPDMVGIQKTKEKRLIPDVFNRMNAGNTGYDVTVEGNLHIIKTGSVNFFINIPSSYVCFTQDWKASILMYALFEVDKSLAQELAASNIHMLILDLVNNNELHVKTFPGDRFCDLVGDMNQLEEKYYENVGAMFADVFQTAFKGVYKTASNVWIALDDDWLLTIVNGQYVVIEYCCDRITDLETEAFHEIADALTVT